MPVEVDRRHCNDRHRTHARYARLYCRFVFIKQFKKGELRKAVLVLYQIYPLIGVYHLPLGLARFVVAELVLVLLVGNALLVSVILHIFYEQQLNVAQELSLISPTGSDSDAMEYFADPDIAKERASTAAVQLKSVIAPHQYAGTPFATTCSLVREKRHQSLGEQKLVEASGVMLRQRPLPVRPEVSTPSTANFERAAKSPQVVAESCQTTPMLLSSDSVRDISYE